MDKTIQPCPHYDPIPPSMKRAILQEAYLSRSLENYEDFVESTRYHYPSQLRSKILTASPHQRMRCIDHDDPQSAQLCQNALRDLLK